MPLYMDFHKLESENISLEELIKTHDEDLAIQDQYGVLEIKYWVNLEAKNLFCLVQGPNKEACNEVHKQSHGNTPCNIIEVSEDEVHLFLGKGESINDMAHTESGEIDTGFRTILLLCNDDLSGQDNHYVKEINRLIEHHKGSRVIYPDDDTLVSFVYASDAILCALAIRNLLLSSPDKIEFNMTLVSGRPVDEIGNDIFEESKKKVQILCSLGLKKAMYLDVDTKVLSDKAQVSFKINTEDFILIKNEDFSLSFKLFDILDNKIDQTEFISEDFNEILGLSKSQTYRKIKSLTGIAPNQLIQEYRLRKSLKYLKIFDKTISETAFDLGFNSPTYFAKLFRKRYGITPSHFIKISKSSKIYQQTI